MKKIFTIFLASLTTFLINGCEDGNSDNISITNSTTNSSNNSNSNTTTTLVLDVDKIQISANWKEKLDINGSFIQITQNGQYGSCEFNNNTIIYTKENETNATDSCQFEVELEDGSIVLETIKIKSLYWKMAKVGAYYTVALKSDGTIWSWGYNSNGELGDGTTTNRLTKVQEITHSHDWAKIDAGGWTTYAIKEDGSLWAWGHNDLAQIGDGSDIFLNSKVSTPTKVSNDSWKDVSSRDTHVLALKSDNSLWSWGSNVDGCVGNGNTDMQNTPYKLDGKWNVISAGENFSIAIRDNGTIYSWGGNTLGELGLGDKNNRLTPTAVVAQGDLFSDWDTSKFINISAGDSHVLAMQENGTVWGWGNNGFGQLTNNSSGADEELTPIKIDLIGVKYLSSGAEYSMAIYNDGTMRGWGDSQYGTIGSNSWDVNIKFPVQESTQSHNWIAVDAGIVHTVAIDKYGQLWAWGSNEYGEIGDGTTTSIAIPKKIYGRNL